MTDYFRKVHLNIINLINMCHVPWTVTLSYSLEMSTVGFIFDYIGVRGAGEKFIRKFSYGYSYNEILDELLKDIIAVEAKWSRVDMSEASLSNKLDIIVISEAYQELKAVIESVRRFRERFHTREQELPALLQILRNDAEWKISKAVFYYVMAVENGKMEENSSLNYLMLDRELAEIKAERVQDKAKIDLLKSGKNGYLKWCESKDEEIKRLKAKLRQLREK